MATKKQMAEAAKKVLYDFHLMHSEYALIQLVHGNKWKYIPFEEFPSVVELNKMIEQVK